MEIDQVSSKSSSHLSKRVSSSGNDTLGPVQDLNITVFSNGTEINRESVLEWEARRIQAVVNKMKHKVPTWLPEEIVDLTVRPTTSIANITQERQALADAKLRAGDFVIQLNAPQLVISNIVMMVAASILRSWHISEIRLVSNKGTAEGFAKCYTSKTGK